MRKQYEENKSSLDGCFNDGIISRLFMRTFFGSKCHSLCLVSGLWALTLFFRAVVGVWFTGWYRSLGLGRVGTCLVRIEICFR